MIRNTLPSDSGPLVELARATEMFKPAELVALREVLDDYHATNRSLGHFSVTLEDQGRLLGFAYYAPASMTENTWYLYWIAVSKSEQNRGLGRQLLDVAEQGARARNGRLLLVETSSMAHYEPTRAFYLRRGYEIAATLADFYAAGDDMVVFRKRLR